MTNRNHIALFTCILLSVTGASFAVKPPNDSSTDRTIFAGQTHPMKRGLKQLRRLELGDLRDANGSLSLENSMKSLGKNGSGVVADRLTGMVRAKGSDLRPVRTDTDKLGNQHIRLQQYYRSIPVVGSDIIVHVNKMHEVFAVTGAWAPGLQASTSRSFSFTGATATARRDLRNARLADASDSTKALVIFDGRLAWQVDVVEEGAVPGMWRSYVDAQTGEILLRMNTLVHAAPSSRGAHVPVSGSRLIDEGDSVVTIEGWRDDSLSTHFLYNKNSRWGVYNTDTYDWEMRVSGSWGTTDRAAVSLAKNFEIVQNYVATVLGRNSFNNAGAFAQANVHEGSAYVNAYWDHSDFHFGDGDNSQAGPLTTLDIVGHEYGHAITEFSSNLVYAYESGALNESFSDILGTLVEFWAQQDGRVAYPTSVSGRADWLCGEDCWIAGEALRDLRNPQRYGNPSYYLGTYWYTGSGDNGGVHYNSGVQNFAFYLLAEGGTGSNDGHPYSLTGMGIDTAGEIALYADMYLMTSNSGYRDARNAWILAATTLGHDAARVGAVWTAVGVLPLEKHLSASPLALDFDSVGLRTSDTLVLTLANSGADATLIDSIRSNNPFFTVSTMGPLSVAGGSALSLKVAFRPMDYAQQSGTVRIYSNAMDNPFIAVPLIGKGVDPAVLSLAPSAIARTVPVGATGADTLKIINTGHDALSWTIDGARTFASVTPPTAPSPFITLDKNMLDTNAGPAVLEGVGGPDAFGYTWKDSREAGGPAFAWTDISTTGSLLSAVSGCDDCYENRALSFPFPFYGATYSTVYVSSNGYVTLTAGSSSLSNGPLPSVSMPSALVAAYFDDLNPLSSGDVYFKDFGDRAVVQFNNVGFYSVAGYCTFQLVLNRDGTIVLYYLRSTGPLTSFTAGIQNETQSTGLQVVYNSSFLADSLAVRMRFTPPWLRISQASGVTQSGDTSRIAMTLDAASLNGGVYSDTLRIRHNAPDAASPAAVPVTLTAQGIKRLSLSPVALNFGTLWAGTSTIASVTLSNGGSDSTTVSSIASDNPAFVLISSIPIVVPPFSQRTVGVRFSPSAVGSFSGMLTVTSNAEDNPSLACALTGTGGRAPMIAVSPAALSRSMLSGQVVAESLTIRNQGGDSLTYSMTNGARFTVSPLNGRIYHDDSARVAVTLNATGLSSGVYRDTVRISHNAPGQSTPTLVPVSMTVTGMRRLSVTPASMAFRTVWAGTADTLQLTLVNIGSDTTRVASLVSSDPAFVLLGSLPLVVPPFAQVVTRVRFAPAAPASFAGNLTISSNAEDNPALSVAMSGVGTSPPSIAVAPLSLSAHLSASDTITRLVNIVNNGGDTLRVQISARDTSASALAALGARAALVRPTIEQSAAALKPLESSLASPTAIEATMSLLLPRSLTGGNVLVFRDILPWGYNVVVPLLQGMGATVSTATSSQMASINLSTYDLIVFESVQGSTFYATYHANRSRFEAYLNAGGNIQFHACTQGDSIVLPAAVVSSFSSSSTNYIVKRSHPIGMGADSIVTGGSANHNYLKNLPAGAEVISIDPSSRPTTIVYRVGSGVVVATGFTWEIGYSYGWNSAIPLLANALSFSLAASSSPAWLALVDNVLSVPPGGSANARVRFSAMGQLAGMHHGRIDIAHNAPTPLLPVVVSCSLLVDGTRRLAASPASVNFGNRWAGTRDSVRIALRNPGNEATVVTGIISSNPAFSTAATSPITIQAFDSSAVWVVFAPTALGSHTGTLTITSNAEDFPTLTVSLNGTGTAPPVAQVGPTSVNVTLAPGGSSDQALVIRNTGGDVLQYQISTSGSGGAIVINEFSNNPDFIELWNCGSDQVMTGWRISWIDNTGTTGAFTFPVGFILRSGKRVSLREYTGTANDSTLYHGTNIGWIEGSIVSVALVDNSSRGVDFVRTTGCTDSPPLGTLWNGTGVNFSLYSAYRLRNADSDSVGDWGVTSYPSEFLLNPGQTAGSVLASWLSIAPVSGTVGPLDSSVIMAHLNAGQLAPGAYVDTIRIAHNAPGMAPLLVIFRLTVSSSAANGSVITDLGVSAQSAAEGQWYQLRNIVIGSPAAGSMRGSAYEVRLR